MTASLPRIPRRSIEVYQSPSLARTEVDLFAEPAKRGALFRGGADRGLERSRPAAAVRPPGRARRGARAHRPPNFPTLRALNAMARKASPEPDFDRELADLPPELRWREWKARVEAVLFAAPKPVTREILARVVGRDCALELLLDDLKEDLRGRPIELVRAGEGFALHTRLAFGPAVGVAFDIPTDAKQLTKLEAVVLMAVAMFQPVTRGEISQMFGREISRDLIAGLREEGLIAAAFSGRRRGKTEEVLGYEEKPHGGGDQ
jgi:segregation and condensation protein B